MDNATRRNLLIEAIAEIQQVVASLADEVVVSDVPIPGVHGPICWGAKVSKDFRESVLWIEGQIKLPANFLMPCMAFETGLTFSPSVKNPGSSATGLIQFMNTTAKDLGTTTASLAAMSAVKQLSYVYYYFKRFGTDLSHWVLEDVYMAILLPNMIGKGLDEPMHWSDEAYMANRGLDADKNGKITKREATEKIRSLYKLGMMKENMA
jgi:hypothetical protein